MNELAPIPTVGIEVSGIGVFTRVEVPGHDLFPGLHLVNAFKCNRFALVVTDDETHHGTLRHASISHANRYPTWEEIKAVRDALYPDDIDVMMVLPKKSDYVNFHENTFHLYQTPESWDIQ